MKVFKGEDIYGKIVSPIMLMFILVILVFGMIISGIIYFVLKDNTLKMNGQTHTYTYNRILQQMNNANNFLYMLTGDTEIDEIMVRNKISTTDYAVVDDIHKLQQKLDAISSLSMAIELNNDVTYISYVTSIIVDDKSSLYETATGGPFRANNGVFKNDS